MHEWESKWKRPRTGNFLRETIDQRTDKNGNQHKRIRVWLGKGHRWANSAGWQWKSRYLMMEYLGRALTSDEHVHHVNGDTSDDRIENFELWLAEEHCRFHGRITVIGRFRNDLGQFVSIDPTPDGDLYEYDEPEFNEADLSEVPF